MNMDLQTQLKALVAAAVGFAATWLGARFGIKVDSPEVQSGIVMVVLYLVTYWTKNKQV